MTEYSSKTLRAAMKAKASRLASGSDATKIGASDFTPAEPLDATVQTGARPLTRRRFKSGGKVVGAANAQRADKKKRGNSDLSADSFINRNVVEANEEREGKKHVGAFKKGGRVHKLSGGKLADYIGEASMDKSFHAGDVGEINQIAKTTGTNASERAMRDESSRKHGKRSAGIALAVEKLAGRNAKVPATRATGGRAKYANEGKVKDVPVTSPKHPMNKDISTRGVTGPSGQYVTDDEIRKGAGSDYPPMPPVRPAPMPPERPSNLKKGGKAEAKCWGGSTKKADSGRAKKFMGGPMMQPGGMMGAKPPVDERVQIVDKNRMNFGTGPSGSPYKKGGKVPFEGSAKDEAQDTKLAKKYGMSMMAWEKSKQDKKHDEQESMTGLKKGGRAGKGGGGLLGGTASVLDPLGSPEIIKDPLKLGKGVTDIAGIDAPLKHGGRAKRASGGKTGKGKGKTNISIVIATGKGQQDGMMPDNGGMPPKMPSPAMPVQAAPAAGMPPMAGAGAPAPQMPMGAPPMPAGMDKMMPRKAGGRVYKSYKDMDAGSGSGMGRLEKTEIAKRTAHKHGGKTYKSYKDMDAGAASGKGRLEKTEIAARGR
jgi:hypothetical protein